MDEIAPVVCVRVERRPQGGDDLWYVTFEGLVGEGRGVRLTTPGFTLVTDRPTLYQPGRKYRLALRPAEDG